MIDGHRGDVVVEFVKRHIMSVIFRNDNIMVRHLFGMGLKQVFLKLDELLASKLGNEEMDEIQATPHCFEGSIHQPHPNKRRNRKEKNAAFRQGCALTVVIVNTDEIHCATVGDCRAVLKTNRGQGKWQVPCIEINKEHKCGKTTHIDEKFRA